MKHAEPLLKAEFIKRYKRFFADVRLDGEVVVAHVPNTGSLKTCLFPGEPCLISAATNPERKLRYTLHFLKTPTGWAGVNTALPNALIYHAWENRLHAPWNEYGYAQREFKISKESRLDMVLAPNAEHFEARRKLHHIEVKNVTLVEDGTALFPDAVSERGQKHLMDLMRLKQEGHGAELVFVIQREGCRSFAPADQIDPVYGRLLREAHASGVLITALHCLIDPASGVTLHTEPLPLRL